jgi:hypothetical protein
LIIQGGDKADKLPPVQNRYGRNGFSHIVDGKPNDYISAALGGGRLQPAKGQGALVKQQRIGKKAAAARRAQRKPWKYGNIKIYAMVRKQGAAFLKAVLGIGAVNFIYRRRKPDDAVQIK